MLSDFAEKKETFLTLKPELSKSNFFKGVSPYFWQKNAIIFLYLDLIQIRLEIMLSDFAEKKETCFDYKKQNFSKSKKSSFPKGLLTHAFGQKLPIFCLRRFSEN